MAFEERLALIIAASTEGAIRPLEELRAEAARTGKTFAEMEGVIGVSMSSLKSGLVAGAAALVGAGLIEGVGKLVENFTEAQTAAAEFAKSMNTTVEQAGALTTVLRAFGVSSDSLVQINNRFAKSIQTNSAALAELGVQVQRNADGTTNLASTMVATVDALGEMGNGLQAATIAAQLFGRRGAAALFEFTSGADKLSEVMDKINFVNASESALKFHESTILLNLSWQQLAITLGAKLVPALTAVVDETTSLVHLFSAIPLTTAAVGAGWVLLATRGKQMGAALVATAGTINSIRRSFTDLGRGLESVADVDRIVPALKRMGDAGSEAVTAITAMQKAWDASDTAAAKFAASQERLNVLQEAGVTSGAEYEAQLARVAIAQRTSLRAAQEAETAAVDALDAIDAAETRFQSTGKFRGMATAFIQANGYQLALAGVAAELIFVTTAVQAEDQAVHDNIATWIKFEDLVGKTGVALEVTARHLAENASLMSRFGAVIKSNIGVRGIAESAIPIFNIAHGITGIWDAMTGGKITQDQFQKDLKRTREAMGEFAAQNLTAEQAIRTLNDSLTLLEQGTDTSADNLKNIAEAAEDANKNLLDQARITDMSATAMGKYAASVQQATKYQGDLVSRRGDVQSALESLTNSVKGLFTAPGVKVKDLPSTFQNEWEAAATGVEDSVWKVIQAMAEVGMSGDQIRTKFEQMGVLKNLPADVRSRVQEALDEIKHLPSERVMDFTIKPKIDFGGQDFADFLKQQGDRARDPTQFKKLMDEFRAQASALKVPVTQDVKVKVDDASLKAAQTTVTDTFNKNPIVPTVNTSTAAKQLAGLADTKISIVPEADRKQVTTERGWLETTLAATIAPPVVPVVHDSKASAALDKLTSDRTMTVTIHYVDSNGKPITGPSANVQATPQAQAVSYGPSMSIQSMTVQANDPGQLYAGLDRIARRQRLVGMPA